MRVTLGGRGESRTVEPSGGLVVVHAHPDDETLATGALLATWAAAGERVTVVTCTRGERGEVIDTAAHPTGVGGLEGDGPALAAYREQELAAALAALGVTDHVFLDTVPLPDDGARVRYEDSGMAWVAPGIASHAAEGAPAGAFVRVALDEAAGRLAIVLRERAPAVVATYDPQGGYGHPDHVRTHEVTVRALELLARDPGSAATGVPALWCVVQSADRVRDARRALAASPEVAALRRGRPAGTELALPDPDEPVLPPVATWWPRGAVVTSTGERLTPERGLVEVPAGPVLDRVSVALRAHATQVQAVSTGAAAGGVVGWYALSNDVLAPLPAAELYAVLHAPGPTGTGGTHGFDGYRGTVTAPASPQPTQRPRTSWVRAALSALLGLVVGGVGTFMFAALLPTGVTDHVHAAASWPVGLVITLALSVAAAILARAWGGYAAYALYAVGWLIAVIVLSGTHGPGGDVLAGAHQRWANIWMYGGFLLVAASAFAPRGWFADAPGQPPRDADDADAEPTAGGTVV